MIGDARSDRENGTIYVSHENINTVRKAMYAFLNGDADKAYSFFHENSRFHDINEEDVMTFDEIKAKVLLGLPLPPQKFIELLQNY